MFVYSFIQISIFILVKVRVHQASSPGTLEMTQEYCLNRGHSFAFIPGVDDPPIGKKVG